REVQVVARDRARDRARPFGRAGRAGEQDEHERQGEQRVPHLRLRDSSNTFRLTIRFRLRTKLAPLTSKATVRSRLLGSPASGSSAARSRRRPLAVKRYPPPAGESLTVTSPPSLERPMSRRPPFMTSVRATMAMRSPCGR